MNPGATVGADQGVRRIAQEDEWNSRRTLILMTIEQWMAIRTMIFYELQLAGASSISNSIKQITVSVHKG